MKIRVFLIFTVITAVFCAQALTAGGSDETVEPAGVQPEEPTEVFDVSFWHIFPEGNDTFSMYEEMIGKFNEDNRGVNVEHMGISFWDYWTKLTTSIAGGTGPDVYYNTAENVQSRIKAGTLVNLSDYFRANGIKRENYLKAHLDYMSDDNGELFAFPYGSPVRVLYWDKDMFAEAGLDPERPPRNWAELEEFAAKLTVFKDGSKDLIDRIGFDPTMGNFYFWTLAWTNGGRFFDDNLQPTVNSPENLEALEWMVKMHLKHGTRTMQAFQSQNSSLKIDPFIAGKAAMEVHNEGLYAQIKQYAPEKNFGVTAIPYQKERASWSSGFTLEIADKGNQKLADAAWELFWLLISPEGQRAFFEETGWIMSDKTLMNDPLVKEDPILRDILNEAPYAKNRVYVEEVQNWHVVIDPEIQAALLGAKSPKEALDQAQKLVVDAIANYKATN